MELRLKSMKCEQLQSVLTKVQLATPVPQQLHRRILDQDDEEQHDDTNEMIIESANGSSVRDIDVMFEILASNLH
jgi:hypothetical protein